jgi:hypothetical protein
MSQPDINDVAAWLHEHDLASKLEGWLLTNDRDDRYTIAKIDDPQAWIEAGWPLDFTEPKFQWDEDAVAFVRRRTAAGSEWHAQAIAIHDARIPLGRAAGLADSSPNRLRHDEILEHCSAGPWRHGLHIPGFGADSQPCIYGDERELPLAILDEDDQEARANVVLMAAAWELCQQLSNLVDVVFDSGWAKLPGDEARDVREQCNGALALLSRIRGDVQKSTAEPYRDEEDDE